MNSLGLGKRWTRCPIAVALAVFTFALMIVALGVPLFHAAILQYEWMQDPSPCIPSHFYEVEILFSPIPVLVIGAVGCLRGWRFMRWSCILFFAACAVLLQTAYVTNFLDLFGVAGATRAAVCAVFGLLTLALFGSARAKEWFASQEQETMRRRFGR